MTVKKKERTMKNLKSAFRTMAIILAFGITFVGCDNVPGGEPGGPVSPPPPLDPALRAVPIAASESSPVVLESYTDGIKNHYVIYAGYVSNMFVSTILQAAYNGMTPISVSRTTVNTTIITSSLTDTISESITFSHTDSVKTGIVAAWKKIFPFAGEFSAKLNCEWNGSWTNLSSSTRSTQTSVSKTESIVDSNSTSFTIGGNGEPAGNYRYALYAVCDVYFIISTSLDNQQLLKWDTVVCARDSTYTPHWDYLANGLFNNSPDGNKITFAEDFYKKLEEPVIFIPIDAPPAIVTTGFETIRTEAKRITDSGRFNQHMDIVNFNEYNIDLTAMKENGYKSVSFYIQLNVREIDDGYQYLFLFNSPIASNNYLLSELRFEHTPGKKDTNWRVHGENELMFENIPIDKFINNEFVIRYGASGKYEDTWENNDLKIKLVLRK